MKNSKAFFSLILIFVLGFALTLSGCGERSDSEKAAEEAQSQHSDAAAKAEEAAKQAEKDAKKAAEEANKALNQ